MTYLFIEKFIKRRKELPKEIKDLFIIITIYLFHRNSNKANVANNEKVEIHKS
jgi:hypothetical protein